MMCMACICVVTPLGRAVTPHGAKVIYNPTNITVSNAQNLILTYECYFCPTTQGLILHVSVNVLSLRSIYVNVDVNKNTPHYIQSKS